LPWPPKFSSAFLQNVLQVNFHYKIGECIENDYNAVSGPSGASDCRDSFVSRCRIALVPLGRSGSDRRAFYRVMGADLANLANLRLRAGAQHPSALLHSPRRARGAHIGFVWRL
jgi:hypothetical protein